MNAASLKIIFSKKERIRIFINFKLMFEINIPKYRKRTYYKKPVVWYTTPSSPVKVN
jgi:hypothetical protein